MRNAGFTLIELMIAVAILAIVAAVALPLYNQYSERAFRREAQADLMNCAQGLERFAAQNFDYDGADAGFPGNICNPQSVAQGRYAIAVNIPNVNQFTLTATPVDPGPMAGDGAMTLDQAGNRFWDGPGPDDNDWEE